MHEPGTISLAAAARKHGRSAEITVTAEIPPGTHIEPHTPTEPSLIPTVVEVQEGLETATVDYPEPAYKELGAPDMVLSVYEGTVRFSVRGRVLEDAGVVRGRVRYQPCVGGACLPPRISSWEADLENNLQVVDNHAKGA